MGEKVTRKPGRIYYCAGGNIMSARTKNHGGGDKRIEAKGAYVPRAGHMAYLDSSGNVGFAKRKVGA